MALLSLDDDLDDDSPLLTQEVRNYDVELIKKRLTDFRFLIKTSDDLYTITGVKHAVFKTPEAAHAFAKDNGKVVSLVDESRIEPTRECFDYLIHLAALNTARSSPLEYEDFKKTLMFEGWKLAIQFLIEKE